MKKITFIMLVLFSFFAVTGQAVAFESKLLDIHNKILEESKKIKEIFTGTKDVILVSTMWDSCIVTITQLEAYFFMVSIFNSINEKDMGEEPVDHLSNWLNKIKKTNEMNINSLNSVSHPVSPDTELHMAALKVYYKRLNKEIDEELEKLSVLKKVLE